MPKLFSQALAAVFAFSTFAGCASISPKRQDFVIVEGKLGTGWNCGTVPRDNGGYFYVCDMPLDVQRVVYGRHPLNTITVRFFFLELDRDDDVVVGPDIRRDRRAAAILWQRENGPHSFVLMEFPGRWCVPDWMFAELNINADERARLTRAGYPSCAVARH